MIHCATIALYTANDCRTLGLYWSDRQDSIIVKENDQVILTSHCPEADLRQALATFGTDLDISLWEPHCVSRRDINDHLSRKLYSLRHNRIILSQQGCTFAYAM